jgi:hypothetical protein
VSEQAPHEHAPRTEHELVERLRSIDVRAPEELHRRIDALVDGRSAHTSRRPPRARFLAGLSPLGLGGAIAIVVVAVVLALGLPSGGSTALSVRDASALTLRAATLAAPSRNPRRQSQLAKAVDGVAFPYWEDGFGWRATGARVDRIDGRMVTTVFYANGTGRRIGYAIVAGKPTPRLGGGVVAWRGGTPYRLRAENGANVVVWLRDGRLCVLAGRGVNNATLLALASWNDA